MKGIILLLLAALTYADRFYYRRVLDCLKNNTQTCTHWNESTLLTYHAFYSTYCLSEQAYVLTPDGPRSMKHLTIGDQIWSYNTETGKREFSELLAWLHRDTKALTNYDLIQTDKDTEFQASDFHNVAFVDEQHKINFKFTQDLKDGDELVGFPEPNPFVSGDKRQVERRGLYTPFTRAGNYFIFNTSQSEEVEVQSNDPMILVHALSQISGPSSQLATAQSFLKLCSFLGVNRQPSDDQLYIHPLYSSFTFLFGSAWHPVLREAKYELDQHFQALPSTPSYSSSSYSSSSSYGFFSATSFSSSCGSSTTSSGCEAERQDKMQALGLSISIVQEVPLL